MTAAREAIESRNDFHQPCPRCGGTLDDKTQVDWTGIVPGGACFFRIRFTCPSAATSSAIASSPSTSWRTARFCRTPGPTRPHGPCPCHHADAHGQGRRVLRWRKGLDHRAHQGLQVGRLRRHLRRPRHSRRPRASATRSTDRWTWRNGALEIAVDELCSIGAEEFPQVMDAPRSVEAAVWILSALDERYRAQGRSTDDVIRRVDEWWSQVSGGQPPPW